VEAVFAEVVGEVVPFVEVGVPACLVLGTWVTGANRVHVEDSSGFPVPLSGVGGALATFNTPAYLAHREWAA
jgi:hypothetical protein